MPLLTNKGRCDSNLVLAEGSAYGMNSDRLRQSRRSGIRRLLLVEQFYDWTARAAPGTAMQGLSGYCIMIASANSCLLVVAAPQYVVLSMLAVVVFGIWIRSRLERRPLAKLARAHSLSRQRGDENSVLDRFADLELLRRGHCRQILDVLTGTSQVLTGTSQVLTGASKNRELTCFRFLTEVGARSRRQLVQYVVIALELPGELQDVRLGRDRELATSLRKAALVDLSEPQPRQRAGPAAYCYMTPADQSHVAAGLLTAWLAEQPEEFAWQVTPGIVAGFARYPISAERIAQLIAATIDFAEVVVDSSCGGLSAED